MSCLLITVAAALSCGGLQQFSSVTNPAPANLVMSSTKLNFGNVAIGSHKSSALTLSNSSPRGSENGRVTQVSATGAGFSVTAPAVPFTMAPGQNASLSVTFAPKSAVTASGQLSITIQGASQPVTVSLSGTGLAGGQLGASPSPMNFGNVTVGSGQTQTGSLSATGGDIVISSASHNGQDFSLSGITFPATVTAGQSIPFIVSFTPQASGSATGQVSFVSNASNSPTMVNLSGTGSQPASANLTISPATLNFGNVTVGTRKSGTITLNNSSAAGSASATITQVSATGTGFSVVAPAVPFTLAPGQTTSLTATFAPISAATASGQLSVTIQGASQPATVGLSGTGLAVGQLGASPSTMNFGTVAVGSSQTQTASLSASRADVTISTAAWNAQDFSLSGISFPLTITAGRSISFAVTFTPQSSGSATGQVSFFSDASNSPTIVSLTGTGGQPVQHSVSLSWNASTSQVSGYNVYRALQAAGPFSKLNSSLITVLSFTDANVQSGTTYYYAVTAVDASHNESPHSNVVAAVVP